jgi:hypothetical protein
VSEPDRAIARLEGALADAGREHEPPPHWEARVLTAIDEAPRAAPGRWWMLLFPAIAAAAAIIIYVSWPRTPAPPQLAIALTVERGGPIMRGNSAHVGDTIHVTATGGAGAHRAVWIYRDDRELVAVCAGDAPCAFPITARGEYAIVLVVTDAPLPTPHGPFDADVAAAAQAGLHPLVERLTAR